MESLFSSIPEVQNVRQILQTENAKQWIIHGDILWEQNVSLSHLEKETCRSQLLNATWN